MKGSDISEQYSNEQAKIEIGRKIKGIIHKGIKCVRMASNGRYYDCNFKDIVILMPEFMFQFLELARTDGVIRAFPVEENTKEGLIYQGYKITHGHEFNHIVFYHKDFPLNGDKAIRFIVEGIEIEQA